MLIEMHWNKLSSTNDLCNLRSNTIMYDLARLGSLGKIYEHASVLVLKIGIHTNSILVS